MPAGAFGRRAGPPARVWTRDQSCDALGGVLALGAGGGRLGAAGTAEHASKSGRFFWAPSAALLSRQA